MTGLPTFCSARVKAGSDPYLLVGKVRGQLAYLVDFAVHLLPGLVERQVAIATL